MPYLRLLKLSLRLYTFNLRSWKLSTGRSSSFEYEIVREIVMSGSNLSCNALTTWEKDVILSQVTWMAPAFSSWCLQVHGEISRLTAQWNDVPTVNPSKLYRNVFITTNWNIKVHNEGITVYRSLTKTPKHCTSFASVRLLFSTTGLLIVSVTYHWNHVLGGNSYRLWRKTASLRF